MIRSRLLDDRLEESEPIFDRSGRLLGIPDLLDIEAGLAIEYDGDDHRTARRHSSDVGREDLFRALWLPATERPWTTRVPEDYTLELPLDVELDLRRAP